MLKARIEVELPGVEALRRLGPLEWIGSLFGAKADLRSGEIETTLGAFSLVEGVYRAFTRAGITDAVSFLVDKRVIYVDTREITHDLDLVWQAAQQRGVTVRPFREMHLVLTRHDAGIHLLFDLRVSARVLEGDPHLTVDVSGRPEALRIRRGETAAEYQHRLHALTRDASGPEAYRAAMIAVASELADAIHREITGARAEVTGAWVELVRPGPRELAKFRSLRFGDEVVDPAYRPVPSRTRAGASAEPFAHHYYDPYWGFTSYLLIDAMVQRGHWHVPAVWVVDERGGPLFDGVHVEAAAAGPLDLVDVGADGVHVDASVPDAAWGGSDVGGGDGGWGGSDVGGGDGGWGGSDVGDAGGGDGGGGSSCGSACSGGSSCGGGCGGGGCGGS